MTVRVLYNGQEYAVEGTFVSGEKGDRITAPTAPGIEGAIVTLDGELVEDNHPVWDEVVELATEVMELELINDFFEYDEDF